MPAGLGKGNPFPRQASHGKGKPRLEKAAAAVLEKARKRPRTQQQVKNLVATALEKARES